MLFRSAWQRPSPSTSAVLLVDPRRNPRIIPGVTNKRSKLAASVIELLGDWWHLCHMPSASHLRTLGLRGGNSARQVKRNPGICRLKGG